MTASREPLVRAAWLKPGVMHFGLGTESKMNEIKIRWPSGGVEVLRDVPADFIYTIVEGHGIESKLALPPP